ncbi:type III secretion system export apparatus subunit SctR [Desulfospira joergensenii]|uniref:type III secretion system export apparatus subunit SctR n=1 Tax=Desulfospira joergensenii TaxID=53329 RepID=UPI0003B4BB4A|nr:type III secretion system export apparatus subunit SctR [Desulfospira joergensenii]
MFDLSPATLIFLMVSVGIAPFALMMVTSYVKIVVVVSLVRNALGVQQVPPSTVLNGLAIVLSLFIMAPTVMQTTELLGAQTIQENASPAQLMTIVKNSSGPLIRFLDNNSEKRIKVLFERTARRIWPESQHDKISGNNLMILIPSFTISELTKAFQIGFLLYLPFVAIDLIISNILLAMGMMMVSPMTISLPFKLLLFVTLDGWLKISQGLMLSYT